MIGFDVSLLDFLAGLCGRVRGRLRYIVESAKDR